MLSVIAGNHSATRQRQPPPTSAAVRVPALLTHSGCVPTFESLDGPVDLEASGDLRFDIEDALSFWYRYGRHSYRSLGGLRSS